MYISLVQEPIEKRRLHIHLVDVHLLYFAAMARTTRIDVNRTTGAKVSLKSWPGICWNPRATSLAFVSFKIPMFIGLLDKHPAAGHYVLV